MGSRDVTNMSSLSDDEGHAVFFWEWFFRGVPDRTTGIRGPIGLLCLIDGGLLIDVTVGALARAFLDRSLTVVATSVLIPLAGIFVGLAFAWAGNAHSLLQTPEVRAISRRTPQQFEGWVYQYQMMVLVVLVAIVGWGLAALGVFDDLVRPEYPRLYWVAFITLFAAASISLRMSWRAIGETQELLVAKKVAGETLRRSGLVVDDDGEIRVKRQEPRTEVPRPPPTASEGRET